MAQRTASFSDNLRGGGPTSPRSATHQPRTPSLTHAAVQDLLSKPPSAKFGDDSLAGRDVTSISVGEIVGVEQIRFVEITTSVEDATNILISEGPNVVLLRESPSSRTAVGTFDHSDLNAYLLLVVGLAQPEEDQVSSFRELAQKGRAGKPIPLKDVKDLGRKEPLTTLPQSSSLATAMEIFAGGIHRIVVVQDDSTDVVGVLTQLKLVQFLWENGSNFPLLENLYQKTLHTLDIGSHAVVSVNGDKPLTVALEIMNNEGITSLPVLDNQRNVVGNISHIDVRLLTKNTALPLLQSSCIHFISVILNERGVNDGQDSYPVFYVNPWSTLAHTIAKLVATRSHRMWIVESASPSSSAPPTPLLPPPGLHSLPNTFPPSAKPSNSGSVSSASAVSASSNPGANMSGRLCGVVSLTDVLNLFARASGLHPSDTVDARKHRRRSSSTSIRRSVDSSRSESISDGSRAGNIRR